MRMSPPAAVQLQDVEPAESALRRTASSQVNLLPPRHGTFNLATTGGRRRVYAIIVAGLFLLAWLLQGAKSHKSHEALDFVVSDAEGYWVYLPSLVLDGNLDFRRQLYWHSGVHPIDSSQFHVTPMGFGNHWPTGVAMTLAPGFLAAHALSIAVYHLSASPLFAPNGYSLAYQFFGVAMVMLLGWCTLAAADDVLARRYKLPGRTITAGVVVYALGSSWAYYIFREPFMSHAIGAAWVMLTILLADKITAAADERRIVWWHWPAIVFTFSMAIICRPTNIVTLILVAWALIATVRAGLFGKTLRAVPLMILAAFPFILQLITWHILAPRNAATGGIAIGYSRREVFDWLHPALWNTLFSSKHGLLFWSPVLLLAAWGYARRLARPGALRDGFFVSLPLVFAALWYLNSAWAFWWFGKAFGARAFVDLSGIFIIGMGFGFDWLLNLAPGRRGIAKGAVWAGLIVNWILLGGFVTGVIPRDTPLFGQDAKQSEPPSVLIRPADYQP